MKKIISICIFLLCFFITQNALAQNRITGQIADTKKQPVTGAIVLLKQVSDSLLTKSGVTDENGRFSLENVTPSIYFLTVSMVGYDNERVTSLKFEKNTTSKDIGTLTLQESITQLTEVAVVAKKALFEQKIDRLVVNVEGSITSAGSSALDVLERSPGVTVNRQDNSIALSGKNGVVIMINGRKNYMSTDAAVQMLSGMGANTIEKIEILGTPPANMDAEGNAGYINLVLKKNENEGLNGSYSLSAGYGKGELGNGNMNYNYRKGKLNLFGNYAYLRFGQEQDMHFYRRIQLNGQQLETDTKLFRYPTRNSHTAQVGFDYQLSEKTTIGGLISGYNNRWVMESPNVSTISTNGVADTFITIKTHENSLWQHLGGSFNVQHTFHKNETLTFSTDYLYYNNDGPVTYENNYATRTNPSFLSEFISSGKKTPIKIAVAQLDYVKELIKKVKMETGVKAVSSQFTNDVSLKTLKSGKWVADPELTAEYKLKESVLAAYSSFEIKIAAKTSGKVGLRYEYTMSNLGSAEKPNIVDRKYGQFFPSLFLNHNFSDKASLTFSYSRRITRPTFNQLAPFIIFSDPYTYFAGNAALQPAISNTLKTDYRYKTTLFTLTYTHEDSTIAGFQTEVKPGTNRQYNIATNLKSQKTLSLSIGQSYSPKKWWTMYANFAGIWQESNAYYNSLLKSFAAPNMTITTTQSFLLPKKFSIEASGYFNSGNLFGIFKHEPFGVVNIGLQKKFKKNDQKLSLAFDNIFNTQIYRADVNIPEQNQYFYRSVQFTQPAVKLSYSSIFGNQKMKGASKKASASDEERKRVE